MNPQPNNPRDEISTYLLRLPAEWQDPLANSLRRRVLRRLQRSKEPLSVADLSTGTGECLSAISYHARRLAASGVIDRVSADHSLGSSRLRFVSNVLGDRSIEGLLAASRSDDEESEA